MAEERHVDHLEIAKRWASKRGPDWHILGEVGRGGTAPVFDVQVPSGLLALKLFDKEFSTGRKGKIEEARVSKQVELGDHDCPYLVKVYDGGRFEDRLFLLMSRAEGSELEKRLADIPRSKVRQIVDQIAQACIFLRDQGLSHRDIKSANIFISDDFERATLLDVSVIREIYDPIGLGTDHDGQLPVVATARYSPPEYLFRLLEPSAELWHAVDVYQLGALLHDIIMREPLFQNEYLLSKDNRYRFAWIVATVIPVVEALDVDQDLIFTARRALDKDWRRRSTLKLEDFLAGAATQQARALETIGLSPGRPKPDAARPPDIRLRAGELAKEVEEGISQRLRAIGVTTIHRHSPGAIDASKEVTLSWTPTVDATGSSRQVEFTLTLTCAIDRGVVVIHSDASLSSVVGGTPREREVSMPQVRDTPGVADVIVEQCLAALGPLSVALLEPDPAREAD